MGGKSSFLCPIFSFLSCKSRRYEDDDDDGELSGEWPARYGSKVRSSDEDYGAWWVGERDVDRKASDYINSFHQRKQVAAAQLARSTHLDLQPHPPAQRYQSFIGSRGTSVRATATADDGRRRGHIYVLHLLSQPAICVPHRMYVRRSPFT